MKYRESQLSSPVADMLRSMGYTVWSEIPHYATRIDMVGRKDSDGGKLLIGVELKTSWSKTLLDQCMIGRLCVDDIYGATYRNPNYKTIMLFKRYGIGMIVVNDDVAKIVLSSRRDNSCHIEYLFSKIHNYLDKIPPSDCAGLPCIKGEGPAIDCMERVKEYKKSHPQAKWKEVYQAVPNHYASHLSMAGAMRVVDRKSKV